MIKSLYKKFQHWSEKGSVFIISDTHFDGSDCKFMDKNWITPEEQIKILKNKVHKNDTLVCLGDCGDHSYFAQLNCYKVLIKGNHDSGSANYSEYFDEIYEGPLFISEKILLSHEPIYGLDFCLNIHGHDHGGVPYPDKYHLNLAANVIDYVPVSLGFLIKDGFLSGIDNIHRKTINKRN